jgi:NTP pyrophosphatase (non-canonical NTP hydrolase)
MEKHQSDKYKEMLLEAIKTDGLQFCLDCTQEEAAELIQAISHLRRGRKTVDEVITEMADLTIMLEMCRIGLDKEKGFADRIESKTAKIGENIRFKNGKGQKHG